MIKTQTKEENKFMKRILPHYYKFVTENPHTMLVRILGEKQTDGPAVISFRIYKTAL